MWTVPARRTKANREHRVPLCGRALEILDEARTLVKGTSPFLFPNRVGKQLEEKQLRRMLAKHKIAAVPHGFRSSFRDWSAEETDHPREVIEAALAHVVPEQGRGGLSAHGPIRAPASAHGRLGGLPGVRDSRTGGRAETPVTRPSSLSALDSLSALPTSAHGPDALSGIQAVSTAGSPRGAGRSR